MLSRKLAVTFAALAVLGLLGTQVGSEGAKPRGSAILSADHNI